MKKHDRKIRQVCGCLLSVALLTQSPLTRANERESVEALKETTLNLIDALVEQGIFTREKADAMVKAAQAKAVKSLASDKARLASAPVRVQYVPESVKQEIREQLRQEIISQAKNERWAEPNAVPAWVDRIKWEGDVRVRYQDESFATGNTSAADYIDTAAAAATGATVTRAAGFLTTSGSSASANASQSRERFRVRGRLGVLAKVSDDWSAGVRMVTGNVTDRVSTNQSMGQDFNKYTLVLDRVYLKYDPVDWLSVSAGKFPNPWLSTDLMWDEDVNFEGLSTTFRPSLLEGDLRPFLTVGAFPLREHSPPTAKSRWLSGLQLGAKWQMSSRTNLAFGAALYHFRNMEGRQESDSSFGGVGFYDASYGQYEYGSSLRQKGNTLFATNAPLDTDCEVNGVSTSTNTKCYWGLASRFKPMNITASVDFGHFDPVHVIMTADYIKNTAFKRDEILQRTGVTLTDGKDYGYLYKVMVGMPKLKGRHDWQASFTYRYLGSDATVDAFTDSDFGLGGTNLKGYILGLNYGLDQNAWAGLRWMSAESIESFSLDASHRFAVDVLQADINVRF